MVIWQIETITSMCKFQILITVNSYLMEDASTGFAVTNHRWSKLWDEYFGDSQDYKGDEIEFFPTAQFRVDFYYFATETFQYKHHVNSKKDVQISYEQSTCNAWFPYDADSLSAMNQEDCH